MKNNITIPFLSVLYLLHSVPALGILYPSSLYALLVVVLFVILTYKVGVKKFVTIIPIFLIPILNIIIKIGDSSVIVIVQQISGFLQSMILPLLCIYIYAYNKLKLGKQLFIIYVIMIFVTSITTYIGYDLFPNASRELASLENDSLSHQTYMKLNIGGFSFIYTLVLLNILVICSIKNHKLFKKGIIVAMFSIFFLIVSGLVIYKSQYTTAILIYSISLLLLLYNRKPNVKHIIVLICIGVIIVLICRHPIAERIALLSEKVESYDVSTRLYDLSQYLAGEHTSQNSDLDARKDIYVLSLNTFLDNPFGVWSNSGNGGHSFVFDNIARFGVLGIILIIIMIYKLYNIYIYPLKDNSIYGYAFTILLIFISFATLNPHIFTNVLMFVLPLYCLNSANKYSNSNDYLKIHI